MDALTDQLIHDFFQTLGIIAIAGWKFYEEVRNRRNK